MLEMKTMRNYFYIIFLFLGFTSCNDGDIIINNFEFEDSALKSCGKAGKSKVLYKINNDNVFETISLKITNPGFSEVEGVLTASTEEIRISLPASNSTSDAKLVYRTYDGEVPLVYFCQDIPPSSPKVNEEFLSVGGTVVIKTAENFEGITDRDSDGVPDVDEKPGDTDGDGILDILDVDDDGDNVLTRTERATAHNDPVNVDGERDTDEDGKPNYLDPDDDGDGVPTKFEVTLDLQLPTQNFNEANVALYLDRFSTNSFTEVTEILENTVRYKYRSIITIEDLQLQNQNGTGEEISFDVYELGEFTSGLVDKTITPTTTSTTSN